MRFSNRGEKVRMGYFKETGIGFINRLFPYRVEQMLEKRRTNCTKYKEYEAYINNALKI